MTIGKYVSSYKDGLKVLRQSGLAKSSYPPTKDWSKKFFEVVQSSDYLHIYQTAIDNLDYSVLLEDDSIIQFSFREQSGSYYLRYAFYDAPFIRPSYDEFLGEYGFDPISVGESLREEYIQHCTELDLKNVVMPLRYEYSEKEYRKGVHPASHIHIGHETQIRLPASIVITPLVFVLFLIKQRYLTVWEDLMKAAVFRGKVDSSKGPCGKVRKAFFDGSAMSELYLK
jgi:hypothetical protein